MTKDQEPRTALQAQQTMAEIEAAFPAARRALFRSYHIGGCSSCGFRGEETLAQVCARQEEPIDAASAVAVILRSQEEEDRLQLTPAQLNEVREAGSLALLVDIRSREEHDAVHITGSELLSQELTRRLLDGGGSKGAVVFYDHQGLHVMDAVSYFIGHGLKEARGLKGGIDAWARDMDPSMPRYQIG